ncbi:radical SAM protein, partial [Frankia sp. CcWB2]
MSTITTGTAGGWPYGFLRHDVLGRSGWRAMPFSQFVLKVHSRCNLSCSYCYVYHQADQGWRGQPLVMSPQLVAAAAARVGEHARRHNLPAVKVILHGGEPLLAGAELLESVVMAFRAAAPPGTDVTFSLQTNGVLLDERFLDLCRTHTIMVGVSVDGALAHHNRRRVLRNGAESLSGTVAGLERLTSDRFRAVFGGLLGVVDPTSDPLEVYESLLAWRPPAVDFLLPHGNWTTRPPGRPADEQATPYADWLITLFDRWYSAPEHETNLRLFQEIITLLLGGHSQVETVGLSPSTVVVLETDGSIEQVDALKSAYHGAASTGLHVIRDDFDRVLRGL